MKKIGLGFLLIAITLILIFTINTSKRDHDDTNTQIYKSVESEERKLLGISFLLQKKMQELGQMSCFLSAKQVSLNGGWCSEISGRNSTQHRTDQALLKYLSKFLKGKKVASFGDGPGIYKEKITELGQVMTYDAFDGAPFVEKSTEGRCQFLDLSVPVYHLNQYDWVISMEVAEHIPENYEQNFLDNLVRYATEGIIFSWAIPGQGGHSHVNLKPFEYVEDQLKKRGFKLHQKWSREIKNVCTLPWLKQNLNVFIPLDMNMSDQ